MTTIGDEVTSERLEEMLATLNGPRDEAFAWPTEFSCAEPEMRSIITELLSRRSTAVGSTPAEGEVVATMHRSDDGRETLFSKGNVPNLMGFTSTPLRTAAQVRANSEGDGGAVKGLDDVLSSAMACDQWPDWLSQIVDQTNEAADTSDMSTEQAVAFGILSALRTAKPADGWQLVPVEPTLDMQAAARRRSRTAPFDELPAGMTMIPHGYEAHCSTEIYAAMLAAAPKETPHE